MHSEYENESLNSSQPLRMDTDIARLVLKEATERRTRTKGITSGVSGHVDYRSRAAGGGFGRRELEDCPFPVDLMFPQPTLPCSSLLCPIRVIAPFWALCFCANSETSNMLHTGHFGKKLST
jgi:hypothetical protein